jgi:hypothetical protein
MHAVWTRIRGPFHAVDCAQHQWERYDVDRAGCLGCGLQHHCKNNTLDSTCPLAALDDGSVCCTVTGYCPPVVRYSNDEYVEQFVPQGRRQPAIDPTLEQDVLAVVEWFLLSAATRTCKQEELSRTVSRACLLVVKAVKQHKLESSQGEQLRLPCVLSAFAHTMHVLRPQRITAPESSLCVFCAQHITRCLNELNIRPYAHKRVSLVVGLLYLMKQGLVIHGTQWLPRCPSLSHCLPHETCLEKGFKLTTKLVCETENEVKLVLRQRSRRL